MPKKQAVSKNEKDNKKRKKFVILFIILIILATAGIGVALFFLIKSCQPSHEGEFNVKVIQPTSQNWQLTVNNEKDNLWVKRGDKLDVVLSEKTSYEDAQRYTCLDNKSNDASVYYASVSSQAEPQTILWRSSQLKAQGEKYVTSFNMNWNFDIVIQIQHESDYESFIYSKDEDDKVNYTYGESLYDLNSPIYRINTTTLQEESIPRDEFNDLDLYIGKNIKYIEARFLTGCTAFNKGIHFAEDGTLETISDNFLANCSAFNQPIEFPNSLREISGNFMYYCTSFNQPIDTKNIEHLNKAQNTSFLMCCTSFNSSITIGNSLKEIPNYFLVGCTSFNKPITIPSNIEHIYDGFLRNCDAMVDTITVNCPISAFEKLTGENICSTSNPNAACVKNGMKIAGAAATVDQWLANFPDLTGGKDNIYRTLKRA